MLPRDYPTQNCSIARTMEIVGDRWTLLVVRTALTGVTRFDELQRRLDIAPNVLTDRLARLTAEGILERRPYQQGPVRHDYLVTDKGRDLWPMLVTMMSWGDHYYAPHGAPRLATHRDCGGAVVAHLTCDRCAREVSPSDIDTQPGPGDRYLSPRRADRPVAGSR